GPRLESSARHSGVRASGGFMANHLIKLRAWISREKCANRAPLCALAAGLAAKHVRTREIAWHDSGSRGLVISRSGRILVVDDEVNARTALAELLRDEGFEVETAADAFKAMGKYDAFTPHIVVTDLKMPGMDGIELVKKLRAMEDPPSVIVMTAFGA